MFSGKIIFFFPNRNKTVLFPQTFRIFLQDSTDQFNKSLKAGLTEGMWDSSEINGFGWGNKEKKDQNGGEKDERRVKCKVILFTADSKKKKVRWCGARYKYISAFSSWLEANHQEAGSICTSESSDSFHYRIDWLWFESKVPRLFLFADPPGIFKKPQKGIVMGLTLIRCQICFKSFSKKLSFLRQVINSDDVILDWSFLV